MEPQQQLTFEAKYYPDELHVVNPQGDVGVCILWTPRKTALEYLQRIEVDLDPKTSRIAVIGNFYGDGLPQLLANILWNPQITKILIFGQDLSGSGMALLNLLTLGVEDKREDHLGTQRRKITGTDFYLPSCIPVGDVVNMYGVMRLGKPSSETSSGIKDFFFLVGPKSEPIRKNRIAIDLPVFKRDYFPSEPNSHVIVRRSPLEAWKEVVFRIMRFGVPSFAGTKKQRLELLNLKVVITNPLNEQKDFLVGYNISVDSLMLYQKEILDPEEIDDTSHTYSYGNRLRSYWEDLEEDLKLDQLLVVAARLKVLKSDRRTYVSLWDPEEDLVSSEDDSVPCLVSLFFRVFENKLTLTANFRIHNAMSAWIKNVYGLMAIQKFVNDKGPKVELGSITIISHSISIDPMNIEKCELAKRIVNEKRDDFERDPITKKRELRNDPNGYFIFTVDHDTREIVADLRHEGSSLVQYRGSSAEEVSLLIAKDCAISDVSHALYVGRQLAIHEAILKNRI